jgi:hypothetical protein
VTTFSFILVQCISRFGPLGDNERSSEQLYGATGVSQDSMNLGNFNEISLGFFFLYNCEPCFVLFSQLLYAISL